MKLLLTNEWKLAWLKSITAILVVLICNSLSGQIRKIDSLKKEIAVSNIDSAKFKLLDLLADAYRDETKMDSAIITFEEALQLGQKIGYHSQILCYNMAALDFLLFVTGNYAHSLEYAADALALSIQIKDQTQTGLAHLVFGYNYTALGEYRLALDHYLKARKIFQFYNHPDGGDLNSEGPSIQSIGDVYLKMNKPDSALAYTVEANRFAIAHHSQGLLDFSYRVFGDIYLTMGKDSQALDNYRKYSKNYYQYKEDNRDIANVSYKQAVIFKHLNHTDSSLYYASQALQIATLYQDPEYMYNAAYFLFDHYRENNEHLAFDYFLTAQRAKDSLVNSDKYKRAQLLSYNEKIREKDRAIAEAKDASRNRWIIIIITILVLIASLILWNRITQLKIKYKMILEQRELEKLKTIDKMKEKFFTNITHELRTPLSLILTPAELYLNHPEQLTDIPKFLERIYKNSHYLLHLINQLLDISKLDAGKMNISLSRGAFGAYISEMVKTFEEPVSKKQLNLQMINNLSGHFLFDPEHWNKIINNLLWNAIKFTPTNGNIQVIIQEISGTPESVLVELVVRDTGIGIKKDEISSITDRFYQADNNFSRKYEGAGIGLSLVSELVKLMGGTLLVNSEEGIGSTFIIRLALKLAQNLDGFPAVLPVAYSNDLTHSEMSDKALSLPKSAALPLVLIVEDQPDLRAFLQECIEKEYQSLVAPNGTDGFVLSLEHMPDIIISDLMMPEMDGYEFCNKIKTTQATAHIPFIMLTARNTQESKIVGISFGADDYISKPFSVEELLAKIKNILSNKKQLNRHFFNQLTSDSPLAGFAELQDEFLSNTYKIIEDHIDDPAFSVELLAQKLEMSKDLLNMKISSVIGLSANELIRQYKAKKEEMQRQILELEAKALRAQMNPHFIFNCMNSIKSLIQRKEEDKAITYLTTFAKLIRTIFENSDKREISLSDEIETCRLYTQLESLRFENKFSFLFSVAESIDLKSLTVPALIIQPFIENAIWHGLMPKESGGVVKVIVEKNDAVVRCIIEDNGIGRAMSRQIKFKGEDSAHRSKGVHLTKSRLDLDNLLNDRNASINIIDKLDENGKAVGTKVILVFSEN